jgi:glycosyltransferase involved in cell wall biosynthesis
VGTRGVPANYGGFETFAEELSVRLVERGHAVAVYCRERNGGREYRGVERVYVPTIRHKYLETVVHTLVSTLHLCLRGQDAVLYCNAANAVFTWMPRLLRMGVALNVDGIERKRKKWNALGRAWYRLSERLATWFPNVVVTDADEIQRYYLASYGKRSIMIPYGANAGKACGTATLDRLGLQPDRYFLYVSRLEPENNALYVRESFEQVATDLKLALVGDAPYSQKYIAAVRDTQDPRIVMPGAIYGSGYAELGSNCFAYVHATEVGGTHPALIENMGRGALTLYLDTPENAEVAGGAGIPFTKSNLPEVLQQAIAMSDAERRDWQARASQRVLERYSWDAVADEYERLLESLVKK